MIRRKPKYIVIIVFILLLIFSGCEKKTIEKDESLNEDKQLEQESKDYISKDFENVLEKENNLNEVVFYMDKNIGLVTNKEADKMFIALENYLKDSLNSIKEKMDKLDNNYELIGLAGDELFFPVDEISAIEDIELREWVEKITNNNYKLINLEGEFYPTIDYEKLKKYNKHITEEIKDYIEVKSLDSENPIAIDAALNISYSELGERILKTENYIRKYLKGQMHKDMMEIYRNKLWIYLSGLDNSPIYDYRTGEIDKDVLQSYEKLGNKKEKITGFIVSEYLISIEENDYIIDQNIRDKSMNLIEESLILLEKTK